MNILMITINDPAGTAIAFARAINRYTDHCCRLITKESRYHHNFGKDLHLPWIGDEGWQEVEKLLQNSDIFHFHMTADETTELGPFKISDYIRHKKIVHHHHGHPDFRNNPHKYRTKYELLGRTNLLVSTPDLLHLLPYAKWQPNLVPIHNQFYLPVSNHDSEKIKICQSPTRKELKNTLEFLSVLDVIKKKHKNVIEILIENQPHESCLQIKQNCHIVFDHMQGYFGVSSLESLSQGKPVIAGLDNWNTQCIKEFTGAEKLPWVIARNQEELKSQIEKLVRDSDLRSNISMNSRRFMECEWNEERVLNMLLDVYKRL